MKTDHSPLTLVVADWAIDPHAVVAACSRHADGRGGSFAILVPACLHGIDWAGDPTATVPCAERQLESPLDLAHRVERASGIPVTRVSVPAHGIAHSCR